jgi:hypothetical protein
MTTTDTRVKQAAHAVGDGLGSGMASKSRSAALLSWFRNGTSWSMRQRRVRQREIQRIQISRPTTG